MIILNTCNTCKIRKKSENNFYCALIPNNHIDISAYFFTSIFSDIAN